MSGRGPQIGPAHRRRVTPEHVGSRVTVRYRITDPERGEIATDVVGHLRSFDSDELVVERRDGERVTVSAAAVLASRVIPPRPDPRS